MINNVTIQTLSP